MNKIKKVKNIIITSFTLFFLLDNSYKLIKGDKASNKVLKEHQIDTLHSENIVAHRGFSGLYQENSLESINEALKHECVDMIEIDIQYTKNKKFILHHDDFINIDDVLINIEDLTLDEIEDLIIKCYHTNNIEDLLYSDTLFLYKRSLNNLNNEKKLIQLSTVLKNYTFEKPLILDIKTNLVDFEMIKELNKLISLYKDNIFIQSDYFPFLNNMIKLYPDYKYLYIIKSNSSLKDKNNNFYGYTIKYSLLDNIEIEDDKLYLIYTINSSKKYLNLLNNKNYKSNMYIITDHPDYICSLSEDKKRLRK